MQRAARGEESENDSRRSWSRSRRRWTSTGVFLALVNRYMLVSSSKYIGRSNTQLIFIYIVLGGSTKQLPSRPQPWRHKSRYTPRGWKIP